MDVKYSNNSWDKSKNALKTLIGLGWGKGVTDYLKDINRNFEDAQNDIRKDDRDGVISFSFTDRESKYQQLFEKIEVLHDYANDAGSMVERVIDEPFYKDIDKFAEKMRDLSIDDYETKNTIGATTIVSTGAYGYGYGQTTTEVPKDSIKLSDIMAGDNFFATNLKAQFAEYSKQNPDQEFTYEQYQSAVSSSRAFEYESIRDGQQNIEFWRDIGIAVVIIATSIVCPPAGLALGIAYGTLELSSAATGKDWLTGREMDAGERATRGAFALLDIIPGVKGLHAFSTATKAGGVALDAVQAGSKLTLKQTAKQSLSNLDAMGKQALRESAERIRNVPKVLKDTANTVKNTAQEGLTATKNMATNFGDNVRNLNFGQPRLVADGFGDVGANFIKNTDNAVSAAGKVTRESLERVDDVPRTDEILVEFKRNPKHDETEFLRQLQKQEDGMRKLTVDDFLRNRDDYLINGRSTQGDAAQKLARKQATQDKIDDLMEEGLSYREAEEKAAEWIKDKAALHDPDQVAGGNPTLINGVGDSRINSSLGSQWRTRIGTIDEQIRELAKTMTDAERKSTQLNIILKH
ncbi:polymorphic toxin type 15 domain-containing protein [Listeria booriae]|uniref:polymorphic toxin type 15 domain-containing protein n=1 Tax=Listeria booriae TaxID=1552123 RepID=UPI00162AEE60|nr:polymorphic toxin type 15 domain-containing protein [Listeria booriae]